MITYGVLEVNGKDKLMERMYQMYFKIKELFEVIKPDYVFLEDTQYQNNFASFQALSQFQGIIMGGLLFEKNIGFQIVQPTTWKSAVGVHGKKRKEQKSSAIQIVKTMFGFKDISEDEAEAILIGKWASETLLK